MRRWGYLLVFLLALVIFTWLEGDAAFADPDSFYHVKMAQLIREQGVVKDFVWLPFTVLRSQYIDHHLFYHFLLIPFISFWPPLIGAKIATVFFAVLLTVFFYWFLKQFKIRFGWLYVLILLFSSPFVFRIGLTKTSALSILVLLLGLYFIFKQKYWPLVLLSWLYVWLYGGFILILATALFYALAQIIVKKFKFDWQDFKPALAVLIGLILGIVINPYFPKNLYFYWLHIFEIGLVNYQYQIGVGAEWYPYAPLDLVAATTFVFILLLIAGFLFVIKIKKQTGQSWTLGLLTLALLVLTIKSRRNVEYFIPLAIIFSAWVINGALSDFPLPKIMAVIKKFFQGRKLVAITLAIYFILTFSFIAGRGLWEIKGQYRQGIAFDKFAGIAEWCQQNIPAKAVIFHSDWDDFPMLFYYNDQNYYIAGLDPTFMYKYNPEMYRQWAAITKGEQKTDLANSIKNNFQASYVIVGHDHPDLAANLNATAAAVRVYGDADGWVYQLK